MIVFYIAFYCVYKLIKDKNIRVVSLWIVSLAVSLFTLYMSNHSDSFWTHAFHFSSLCFVWGVMLHEYYDKYINLIMDKRICCSIILLIVGCVSCICLKMPKGSFMGGVILHNIIGICVMTIVFTWCHFIEVGKIYIIGGVTKYATEIYLYQFICISIIKNIFVQKGYVINIIYVVIVVIVTICLAMVMHYVNGFVAKGLDRLTFRGK